VSDRQFEDTIDAKFPTAWRPDQDEADTIIGTFVEMQSTITDYGQTFIMVLELADGSHKAVWLLHTVLKNELARAHPKPGERVGIKYLGEQKTQPGSKYKSFIGYRVKVDRPQGEAFDWSKLGGEVENYGVTADPEQAPEPVAVPAGAGDDDIPF
jgi:hypothetical protein